MQALPHEVYGKIESMREQWLVKQRYPHIHLQAFKTSWNCSIVCFAIPLTILCTQPTVPKACATLTVIHTCRLSFIHVVSSTYGISACMYTLPRTSITIAVDFGEKAARNATFKFIESRQRGKQVDHCFNGWHYLYSQELLEFLMTLTNLYRTHFNSGK